MFDCGHFTRDINKSLIKHKGKQLSFVKWGASQSASLWKFWKSNPFPTTVPPPPSPKIQAMPAVCTFVFELCVTISTVSLALYKKENIYPFVCVYIYTHVVLVSLWVYTCARVCMRVYDFSCVKSYACVHAWPCFDVAVHVHSTHGRSYDALQNVTWISWNGLQRPWK